MNGSVSMVNLFFGFTGRINRLLFLYGLLIVAALMFFNVFLIMTLTEYPIIFYMLYSGYSVIMCYMLSALLCKRFADMNFPWIFGLIGFALLPLYYYLYQYGLIFYQNKEFMLPVLHLENLQSYLLRHQDINEKLQSVGYGFTTLLIVVMILLVIPSSKKVEANYPKDPSYKRTGKLHLAIDGKLFFSGRVNQFQFTMAVLRLSIYTAIIFGLLYLFAVYMPNIPNKSLIFSVIGYGLFLLVFYSFLVLLIKRLHDLGSYGKWLTILVIYYYVIYQMLFDYKFYTIIVAVSILLTFILFCITPGSGTGNKFGTAIDPFNPLPVVKAKKAAKKHRVVEESNDELEPPQQEHHDEISMSSADDSKNDKLDDLGVDDGPDGQTNK